jgi:CO dehydrogenase/acetyl-CoA synthase beta subunit
VGVSPAGETQRACLGDKGHPLASDRITKPAGEEEEEEEEEEVVEGEAMFKSLALRLSSGAKHLN